MKILVTGASGFAGSHLVEALLSAGYDDLYGTAYGNPGYINTILNKDRIILADLTQREKVFELLETVRPDWIFHLAAFAFVGQSFERGAELLNNNITLQLHMLEAMRLHVPKARMLAIGSAEEYGLSNSDELPIHEDHPLRPINPYAVSKVAQDLLAHAYTVSYGLDIVRVRPFNHIGERQTQDFAVAAFAKQIVAIERGEQEVIKVGNLTGIRDFTDVKDMVRAYILLMEKGKTGEVYNIGTGVGEKMSDMVEKLIACSTKKNIPLVQDKTRLRPLDIPEIVSDASKITSLGWKPQIGLDETVQRIVKYWRLL